jgi:hypothetical protein
VLGKKPGGAGWVGVVVGGPGWRLPCCFVCCCVITLLAVALLRGVAWRGIGCPRESSGVRRKTSEPTLQPVECSQFNVGPPPRQFQNAVPELFTGLYVFRVLGGTPVHLTWRGDLSRLKKTFFGHIA